MNINDTYGYLFGDKVSKIVASALKKIMKGKDLVARFGSVEFVVILPDTNLRGAAAVAENIRAGVEDGRVFNPKTGEEIERITI
ncbi:MAG: diguanylate cyclase [Gammaproteobacteria bacterium]